MKRTCPACGTPGDVREIPYSKTTSADGNKKETRPPVTAAGRWPSIEPRDAVVPADADTNAVLAGNCKQRVPPDSGDNCHYRRSKTAPLK